MNVVFGHVQLAAASVAVQKTAGDVISVRQGPIHRGQDGEWLASLVRRLGWPCARQRQIARWFGRLSGNPAGQSKSSRRGQELATRTTLLSILHGESSNEPEA